MTASFHDERIGLRDIANGNKFTGFDLTIELAHVGIGVYQLPDPIFDLWRNLRPHL